MDWRDLFGDFDGRIWLNTAHQGAMPLAALAACREAAEWKISPRRLTQERFDGVPRRLREALARWIGARAEDVVLANGASHGQHLWASGLGLGRGDEVLLARGDFPSNRLPWLRLRGDGVEVRDVSSRGPLPTADEVGAALGPRTRALSMSWVHSFSGRRADLGAIGSLCRDAGVTFLVNTTQGLGARDLDVSSLPVDGITNAGWKWLCGPYATGFCWMTPRLRQRLSSRRAYWLAFQTARDLQEGGDPDPDRDVGARRFDLFAPANFLNFHPWTVTLELLLDLGVRQIRSHDIGLAERILAAIDRSRYRILGTEPPGSPIVVLQPLRTEAVGIARKLSDLGIDVAVRRGCVRLSPHLYNSSTDVDRAVDALNRIS